MLSSEKPPMSSRSAIGVAPKFTGRSRRARVDVAQAGTQPVAVRLAHQVGFAQQDAVGETHLFLGLVEIVELLPACLASTTVTMASSA